LQKKTVPLFPDLF